MTVSRPNIQRIGGVPRSNYGGKRGIKPTHITDHHVVGDAGGAIAEARNPAREMSFTFTIGSDGIIWQMLELDDWPYTDGNSTSNRRAITIEHAGGVPHIPYTEAMYRSSIHLHAWLRQEFGIPEGNILRHQQVSSSPTACPGGLDTERIKRESTNLLKGAQNMPTLIDEEGVRILAAGILERPEPLQTTPDLQSHIGGDALAKLKEFWYSPEGRAANEWRQSIRGQLAAVQAQAAELAQRPTKENFDKLQVQINACVAGAEASAKELEAIRAEKAEDEKTGNALVRWIVSLLKREK